MDRNRGGGDRFGNNSANDSHPYRYPRGGGGGGGPPPYRSSDEAPMHRHRGGFSGNRRPFEGSPPRYSLSGGPGGGGFRPMDGDGGFRPMGGRGVRNYNNPPSEFEVPLSGQKRFNPDYEVPMSGQKRPLPFPDRGGGSPPEHFDGGNFAKKNFDGGSFDKKNFSGGNFDKKNVDGGSFDKKIVDGGSFDKKNLDGGSFAKLFVGSVPKTATEEIIRPVFEEHGNVLEVALIKDKKTGQQQGCCFIKYATSEEADRATRALHNQFTLPGGVGPIQVRYADGERERLGAVEYKLFVGSLNRQATEKEVEEIFLPYGRVEDVYLMRDEMKQSRGCGFVKFSNRDVAMAAINALNGTYVMRGCDQPLIVRFADPKRPRPGETRGAPALGGPGFGSQVQSPGLRPPMNPGEAMHTPIPGNPWHPMNQQNNVPPDVGIHGFGGQVAPNSGDRIMSSFPGGTYGGHGASADGSFPGLAAPSTSAHQLQQTPGMYSQASTSSTIRPTGQLQAPNSAGQAAFAQGFPSQPMHGFSGQSAMAQQYQMPGQQQILQPGNQSASPLAQMLSQQKQTLQASYQSSQQAFSHLQQQLQLMQPSNQSLTPQQNLNAGKMQSPWVGGVPQSATASTAPTGKPSTDSLPATSATSVAAVMPSAVAPVKCNWTEHTSPDGFKYYHNSTTGESKWEKPEELILFEQQQQQQKPQEQQQQKQQQQQNVPVQQPHAQGLSNQQTPQMQSHLQTQMQTLARHPQQLQHAYQAAGVAGHQNIQGYGYAQMPMVGSSMNDPARFQQGLQAAQDLMWKNKQPGP